MKKLMCVLALVLGLVGLGTPAHAAGLQPTVPQWPNCGKQWAAGAGYYVGATTLCGGVGIVFIGAGIACGGIMAGIGQGLDTGRACN